MKAGAALLILALSLTGCSGYDYVKTEAADAVNSQHKSGECPKVASHWMFTPEFGAAGNLAAKQIEITSDGETLKFHDHDSDSYWLIDGEKHELFHENLSYSGYCAGGVIEIDVLDAALKAAHIQITLALEPGTGLWLESSGGHTARAQLLEIRKPVRPAKRIK